MTIHTCDFCGGTFSSKISLYNHQKTAKYCLEKREERINEKKLDDEEITLCNLDKDICHILIEYREKIAEQKGIITEKDKHISELQSQVKDLLNKLENIAIKSSLKPTITNNILKLEKLTDSHLKECANLLESKNILNAGALAEFASKYSFKNRVMPTDASRKILVFRDENNNIIKDAKGRKLSEKFFQSVNERTELLETTNREIYQDIDRLNNELTEDEINEIFEKMNDFIQVYKGIKDISQGEENELREIFISKLVEIVGRI